MVDSIREENRTTSRLAADPAVVEPRHEALRSGLPSSGFTHEEVPSTSYPQPGHGTEDIARTVTFGFAADAVASIGTLVLAIVALSKVYPAYLGPIACIVAGAALILKSGSVAARFSQLSRETGGTSGTEFELGSGMSTELVAGVGGVVLGVLAVLGIYPVVLTACAVIGFGAALLLGGGETYRVSQLRSFGMRHDQAIHGIHVAAESAAGVESLCGIGAIALGVIALCLNAYAGVLILTGLLVVGSAELLAGGTVSGYLGMLMNRKRSLR